MNKKSISIDYLEYKSIDELPENDAILLSKAIEAAKGAYAPYSKFRVGAALRLKSGKIVLGANQENSAFPSGLCAERTAMFAASANNPQDSFDAIAITAIRPNGEMLPDPTYPCGACRQVMVEYEMLSKSPLKIIIGAKNCIQVFEGVRCMMPFAFDNLNK